MLRQQEALPKPRQMQLDLLRKNLKDLKRVCVAYSGGVDSTLVAAVAHEQLGSEAQAITGVSAALAPHLRVEAQQQAAWIGIRHKECSTNELLDPAYNTNPKNRCFACKQELHHHLEQIAKAAEDCFIVDGVNHDDLSDYRPGIEAARQAGVRSPLAELKIDKASVRQLSKALGLPWWDKPSQPCLASRFPYGQRITDRNLKKVAKAEKWLQDNGFSHVRVRIHQGLSASIEIPNEQIPDLITKVSQEKIRHYFLSIGFSTVSIDLEGLVSGKLNRGDDSHKEKRLQL